MRLRSSCGTCSASNSWNRDRNQNFVHHVEIVELLSRLRSTRVLLHFPLSNQNLIKMINDVANAEYFWQFNKINNWKAKDQIEGWMSVRCPLFMLACGEGKYIRDNKRKIYDFSVPKMLSCFLSVVRRIFFNFSWTLSGTSSFLFGTFKRLGFSCHIDSQSTLWCFKGVESGKRIQNVLKP